MHAAVEAIEYYLPESALTTEDLSREFPEWTVEKIDGKTGIRTRHIAGPDECSSDLAVQAARKLFASGVCQPENIDFVLLCTQSPDYFLPTTACVVQNRLGIPTAAGALDFNLGCSGYVYGLGLGEALIVSGQASRVLLLTAETYSKFIHPRDKSVRTIFGDAAAATLLTSAPEPALGPFVYGTDGAGAENLIVRTGGMRHRMFNPDETQDDSGNVRTSDHLYMNGGEIFAFTINAVPASVRNLLTRAGRTPENIDLFIFHQANRYMLEHLRRRMNIPESKFVLSMEHCGNTVSSTIPIALRDSVDSGRLRPGMLAMLVGFGVGYSWGATLLRWTGRL